MLATAGKLICDHNFKCNYKCNYLRIIYVILFFFRCDPLILFSFFRGGGGGVLFFVFWWLFFFFSQFISVALRVLFFKNNFGGSLICSIVFAQISNQQISLMNASFLILKLVSFPFFFIWTTNYFVSFSFFLFFCFGRWRDEGGGEFWGGGGGWEE